MERGLLWLPLLFIFIWLSWAGWNEYQKVEAYRTWAAQFDRAKYDIYAVLGQKGDRLTWGKPTRSGPVNLQEFSLKDVRSIRLLADERAVSLATSTAEAGKGRDICLEFSLSQAATARIPFTEMSLAMEWGRFLEEERQKFV